MATTMARVAVGRGRFEEAHRLIDGIEVKPSWGEDRFATLALVDLARAEGRFAFVATAVNASIDGIAEVEAIAPVFELLGLGVGACADRAVLAGRRRRQAEVEDAAAHAHRWLGVLRDIVDRALPEGGAGPWPEAILATAEAEMSRLQQTPDPRAWADVVARWVTLQHPYRTAYARLRLAEALLEGSGEQATAETALRQAHGVAAAIGAAVLLAEVEALAGAARIDLGLDRGDRTGASQPEASVGIPVLTAREQGVLRLVAEGHTNREIGDQLFISEKTASVHVSNAMAKLGALSRYEAAATAERLGLLA
jgi:DNA-binding CsgD family transcriptional regulator